MRRLILVAGLGVILAGCATNDVETPLDDGYQPGDVVGTVDTLQAQYCANADPRQRAYALAALEALKVTIPDRGACTDILELVDDREVEALDEVDVEAAKQDQKEAQERLEAQEKE
ncbi:hypothetical protein [Halomonas sp. NO4]|uniref:hypothetical protein n=1 Tax=Halomonas sp. NO4 TaxID=2484813 RepID=UPI0013D886FB|nr:hypothetical protein [Halomonas sp. NO4]